MPIIKSITGRYWTNNVLLWIALEDGTAVQPGLHDLRFLSSSWV